VARNVPLPAALHVLTGVTGLVDAVSFFGFGHVFTANMTGNIVFLAFAVAGAPHVSVTRTLTSLAAFLVGAVAGGRLGKTMATRGRRRWLLTVAVVEAGLLFTAAAVSLGIDPASAPAPTQLYVVIALTALAMGVRNATARRLAVADLTTTVLTLTLTGLAAESSLAGGSNPRVCRRVVSVALMFVGAAIGTVLVRTGIALPLAVSGVCVLAATVAYADEPAPPAPV
jgi:uncharacterized membrane protein YoaK (UPF0700 family)